MADNLEVVSNRPDPTHFPAIARKLVFDCIKSRLEKTDLHITFAEDEVYVVWFAYTLGNWKALCSTTLPDGRYYEVTYKRETNHVFIDTYIKVDNLDIDLNTTH